MRNIDNSEYSHTYSSWLIILKLEIIINHADSDKGYFPMYAGGSIVKTTEQ